MDLVPKFSPHARRRLLLCEWFCATEGDHALRDEGRAILDALYVDLRTVPRLSVTVLVSRAVPAPTGAKVLLPPASEALFEFILHATRQYDFAWIIAPESDGLLAALARGIDAARWLGCLPAAIEVTSSKRATLRVLHEAGILTPLACHDCARWVVKPDDGAGALGVRVHASLDEAMADCAVRHAQGEDITIEPWVDGEARSLTLLCGTREVRLLSVNRQRLARNASGELEFEGVDCGVIEPTPALLALAARVHTALPGLRGLVGLDFVEHPRYGAVVIEINPRPTSACVGLAAKLERSPAAELLGLLAPTFEL